MSKKAALLINEFVIVIINWTEESTMEPFSNLDEHQDRGRFEIQFEHDSI